MCIRSVSICSANVYLQVIQIVQEDSSAANDSDYANAISRTYAFSRSSPVSFGMGMSSNAKHAMASQIRARVQNDDTWTMAWKYTYISPSYPECPPVNLDASAEESNVLRSR